MSSLRGYFVPVILRATELRTVMVDMGDLEDYGLPAWAPGEPIDMDDTGSFGELWKEGEETSDVEETSAEFAPFSVAAHPYYVAQGPPTACPICGEESSATMYRVVAWHLPSCSWPGRMDGHPEYPGPPDPYEKPPTKEGIMSPADHEGGGESGQAARFTSAVGKDGYSKEDREWQNAVDKGMDGQSK